MIIFMSQAPIFVVTVPVLLLVALLEAVGIKTRHNIAILSAASLLCLAASILLRNNTVALAEFLYAAGLVLGFVLILYTLVTARRGRQWAWFVGILIAGIVTVGAEAALRGVLTQRGAETMALLIFALTFVPAVTALAYGLFAPDIRKPRGGI